MDASLVCSPRQLTSKLVRLWRDEGPSAVIRRGCYKHSIFYIWENRLAQWHLSDCDMGGIVIQRLSVPLSLQQFEAAYRTGVNEQQELPAATLDGNALVHLADRVQWVDIAGSTVVFRAILDGVVVHQTWIGVGRGGCGQYEHFYPDSRDHGRTAYCGLSWTSPAARGRGILSYMYAHIYRFLAESGCEVVVDAVERHVRAAQNTQERLGAQHILDGHAVRIAGILTLRYVTAPRAHD